MADRVSTYRQAFEEVLGIKYSDKVKDFVKQMESKGHNEHGICFAIWRSQEKLNVFKQDSRFFGILRNEINKWSWTKDDPRWEEYWKKKGELEKAAAIRQLLESKKAVEERKVKSLHLDAIEEKKLDKGIVRKKDTGYIYFVQGDSGGAIKIGYSIHPENRLRELQTGYPDTLKILLLIPGNEDTERMLHRKFEALKLKGEWFKPKKELIEEIEGLKVKFGAI